MASQEAFTLDSLALNDGVTFGVESVSWPPPRQRQEWISAADSESALLSRVPLHENRKVTLRVGVIPQATMDLALAKIASVLDKLQKASKYQDGIALVWTPATSTLSCTFDVLSGEITDLPINWEDGWLAFAPTFTIELTCKPYWRGTEVLTSTATASTPFVTQEVTNVGDVPGLGRLIVTDMATQSRRHIEWGAEGPLTYNSSTSLLVDSDDMTTSGFAGAPGTTAGAYDPNSSGNDSIVLSVPPGATTAVCGTGNLSHVGTFRVKGRLRAGDPLDQFRLSWRAGDGPLSSNDWVTCSVANRWEEKDLGTITIPTAIAGTQRWTGQVEAYNPTAAASSVYVDYLILIPTSDGYGKARATPTSQPGVIAGYDAFTGTTAAAALGTRSAPAGGSWATSGDATDFAFADAPLATDETLTRSAALSTAGRIALLGTGTPTDVEVQADVYNAGLGVTGIMDTAVVARYVDASNYLYATLRRTAVSSVVTRTLEIRQVVAAADTLVATSTVYTGPTTSRWFTVKLTAYASGSAEARVYSAAGAEIITASGASSAVAGGGALASGKSGLLDKNTTSNSFARYYDNFKVTTPAAEAVVLYSGRTIQFRHDVTIRDDSAGVTTGIFPTRGSRFVVPVGTSRVMVKARRNDVEAGEDANVTDSTRIQVGYTPRGLAVPRA